MISKTALMAAAMALVSAAPAGAQTQSPKQSTPQTFAAQQFMQGKSFTYKKCAKTAYHRCRHIYPPRYTRTQCWRIALRQCGRTNQL